MNELITIENVTPLQLFSEGGLDSIIGRIETEARREAVDISTAKGRDEVKSLAFKIAKSKTAIDKMGKELTAEWKEKSKKVDAERSRAWDRLELLQKEIRQPLTDWENRDKARTEEHEAQIAAMQALAVPHDYQTVKSVQESIDALQRWHNYDWEEFSYRAKQANEAILDTLQKRLVVGKRLEAEQAELERLRKEEIDRKQREHEERLKKEAADQARLEAESVAKKLADEEAARVRAEQEKAEQERIRIEREKQEALNRVARAEADRIAVEEKAKADAVAAKEREAKAENERLTAEAKAKADAEAAAIEAEKQAKIREEAAAQKERDIAAATARKEAEETAKREADKKHRATINNEALAAISLLTGEDIDEKESSARKIVEAIAKGQVPHTKISY